MKKIYTYANPFKIVGDNTVWEAIKDAPHLCISETLVQGLTRYFGRGEFTFIYTIDNLMKKFYKAWSDNPENDIKQYVSVSNEIERIEDTKLRKSFKFNQKDVVLALRFLVELGIETVDFTKTSLSEEQNVFLNMYNNLLGESCWRKFDSVKSRGMHELVDAFEGLLAEEINKDYKIKSCYEEDGLKKIEEYLNDEENYLNSMGSSFGAKKKKKQLEKKVKTLSRYKELVEIKRNDGFKFNKIVFHGVHQFTPLILNLIDHLEKELEIEIIFIVNYCEEFSKTYETWENVYKWTRCNFENIEVLDRSEGRKLGLALGKVLEGNIDEDTFIEKNITKYENLTSFSDKVAHYFQEANDKVKEAAVTTSKENLSEEKDGKNLRYKTLASMAEQFYAVRSETVNNILKVYFPDQFGDKHFLSYPIGQFILGLYNMWDEDEKQIVIKEDNFKECLVVNFWPTNLTITPIGVYEKIKLYLTGVEKIDDVLNRVAKLKNSIYETKKQADYESLRKFSFFSLSIEEIEYFETILKDLKSICNMLFENIKDNKVNFSNHYKKLMNILSEKAKYDKEISELEERFVQEISNRLETNESLDIEGSISDLRETLHFYLNRRLEDSGANWIVRDFEQIDGGVLLSEDTKGKAYHYALLSDNNMKVKTSEFYSWPLTEDMFEVCNTTKEYKDIVITAHSEYKNFLRYSLFYGTFFLYKDIDIELSYIENSEGEKEIPYFLLKLAGVTEKPAEEFVEFETEQEKYASVTEDTFPIHQLKDLDKENYYICPYRYILNRIMEKDIFYTSEFQCRYYYIILLMARVWKKFQHKTIEDVLKKVKKENESLKILFPFWEEVDFQDLESKVARDIIDYEVDREKGIIKTFDKIYMDRKENFLLVKLTEEDNEIYNLARRENMNNITSDIKSYMENYDVNELNNRNINDKICQYCNQREICLNNFIEEDE